MEVVLPHRKGGLHLLSPEEAQLNPEVTIMRDNGQKRRPDLLVPSINLALEYDGEKSHSGEANYKNDAGRRLELASCNIEEIVITEKQLFDDAAMDLLARTVSKKLGRKYDPRGKRYFTQRHNLYRFLTQHMMEPFQACNLLAKHHEKQRLQRAQRARRA